MKFTITNTRKQKTYEVNVVDENKAPRIIRKKVVDEEICPKCNKKLSECQCEKEQEEIHDEEVKLTKEEIETLKELAELLPDLKKLLEKSSDEKKSKKEKESEESQEEEKEEISKKDEIEKEETEVILEQSDDDKDIVSEEFDFEEEDVIEDECGNDVHDSVINPGTIEKTVSDSNKDTLSRESEVAKVWEERYNSLLKS